MKQDNVILPSFPICRVLFEKENIALGTNP